VRQAPQQLESLSRRLRTAADRGLYGEIDAGLLRATKPMMADAKARMAAKLPERGGLAAKASAARMQAKRRKAGHVAIIVSAGRQHVDAKAIDRGLIRHPVFNRPESWVGQRITPFTITGAFQDDSDVARRELEIALERVADQIDGKRA
jgi:hypothetical protein